MALGIPMKVGKVDVNGGIIPGPGKPIRLTGVSLELDGIMTLSIPRGFKIPVGNHTCRTTGIGGDDGSIDFNDAGELTFTADSDSTAFTGVNTSVGNYAFPVEGCYVTGIPLEPLDVDTPNRTTYDWDE